MVDPKIQERIDNVMRIVRLLLWGLLAVIYFFGRLNKVLSAVGILFTLASLILWLRYPHYFSEEKAPFLEWNFYFANQDDIAMCCFLPPMMLGLRTLLDFTFPSFSKLYIVTLLGSVPLGALIWSSLRKHQIRLVIIISSMIMICLCMFGVYAQLNYILDDTSTDTQPCQIVDFRAETSRRPRSGIERTSYYCIVETESGEQTELPISKKQFDTLRRGDVISCYFGKGALGIEYSYISNAPPAPRKKTTASIP